MPDSNKKFGKYGPNSDSSSSNFVKSKVTRRKVPPSKNETQHNETGIIKKLEDDFFSAYKSFFSKDYQNAKEKYQAIYKLSKKLHLTEVEGVSLFCLSCIDLNQGKISTSKKKLSKAFSLMNTSQRGELSEIVFSVFVTVFPLIFDFVFENFNAEKAFSLIEEHNPMLLRKEGLALLPGFISVLKLRNDIDGAIYFLKKFQRYYNLNFSIDKNVDLEKFNAKTHLEIGSLYVKQGRWYEGLDLFKKALEIYSQKDDLSSHANTIFQIGRTHHLMGNLDTARIHYHDALRLFEHLNHQAGIASCKNGLGHLDLQLGYVDDALPELQKARELYQVIGNDKKIASIDQEIQLANQIKERIAV